MHRILLVMMVCVCFLQACVKEQSDFITNPVQPAYSNDILGIVVDEEGQPVVGAAVRFDGQVSFTDIYGVYQFKNVKVSAEQSYLTIEKTGYFNSGRGFSAVGEGSIKLRNVLLKKEFEYFFDAGTGGSITESNITLHFPAKAIVDQTTGHLFEGQVKVAVRYIDPESAPGIGKIPGNNNGLTASDAVVCLAGFGTVAVELEGIIGIPLNLAPGSSVRVINRLPSGLIAQAPPATDVWAFDPNLGYWRQEGRASLEGDSYVTELEHLSYWTFARSFEPGNVQGRIVDQEGRPLAFASLYFKDNETGFQCSAYTDGNGRYIASLPLGASLAIEINRNSGCNITSVDPDRIGPVKHNTYIPDLRVETGNGSYTHITGKLISCAGAPVQNGYALALTGNGSKSYLLVENGNFDGYILACDDHSPVTITGVNRESNESSVTNSYPATREIYAGEISVCKEEKDYVRVRIEDLNFDTTTYTNVLFTDNLTKTLEASLPLNPPFIGISWSENNQTGVSPGQYTIEGNQAYLALAKDKSGYDFYKVLSGTMHITQGATTPGKTIRGSFIMEMQQTGRVQTTLVEGNFKATFY